MAFKLSAAEKKQRDALADKLEQKRDALENALLEYNETLEEVSEFVQDIASTARDAHADKSDTWQEGERGQAAEAWADEWENFDASEHDIDLPEHAQALRDLPEAAE